jgi:hypothetical protein
LVAQHVAGAVDMLEHLRVGDAFSAALNRNFGASPFSNIAIDKPACRVEGIRQRDHALILSRVVDLARDPGSGIRDPG